MRIGIIGAGQLGQMLGFAAGDLGFECMFVDPSESPPAADCGLVIRAPFDSHEALKMLAEECDIVTFEFENVPVEAMEDIKDKVPIYPPPAALRHAQDRLAEKRLFETLGIPLPGFRTVDTREDLDTAAEQLGLPLVLKTRRLGYDGKGQFVIKDASQLDAAWTKLGGSELIAEQWVPFDFEVSVIGVRNVDGDTDVYPLVRNQHRDGILHCSRAPVDEPTLSELGSEYMRRMLDELDYVGVLALELFVLGDRLLANEFAPRVHNSGHWTIEGAETSQFTNHLLAICNRTPGPTHARGHAGMLNLIGTIPSSARSLTTGHLHDYGKVPRAGRKLGHVTVVAETASERDRQLREIEHIVTQSTGTAGTVS